MKPYEVALFKEFTSGKGMVTPFIQMYKSYRLKANPVSIEAYLSQVDVKEAYMKAFYWLANSRWGYNFWLEVQHEFDRYVAENPEDEQKEPWWYLHGKCRSLRMNWDSEKHWKEENRVTTAKRLGIELPEYVDNNDFADDKMTNVTAPVVAVEKKSEPVTINDALSVFGEFEFVDLRPKAHESRRLADDEFSVNRRDQKGRITINQKISKEIKGRGGYEYAALMRNKKGETILVFNDTRGVTVQDGAKSRPSSNVTISSKTLVDNLVKFIGLEYEYEIIRAKEMQRTNDFVAYLLTRIEK